LISKHFFSIHGNGAVTSGFPSFPMPRLAGSRS
jgi:hypothetical protein